MTWADDAVVYRDVWADSLRLIVAGVDVTQFRDAPAEWGTYQLQEPFDFGPASFRFPQVSDLELRSDPDDLAADLTWLRKQAPVELVPIVSGLAQAPIWRGFVAELRATSGVVEMACDGEASGRLALTVQPPPMFHARQDIGLMVFEAFRDTNITFTPVRGPTTGIVLDKRGGFEDRLSHVNSLLSDSQKLDGTVWTVRRHATRSAYEMVQKDLTTVDCTIHAGTPGIDPNLSDALAEQPNTFYGSGIRPDGMKYNGGVVPGVYTDPTPPDYPIAGGASFGEGTVNADTVNGDGISVMHARMIAVGAMDRDEAGPIYDEDTTEGVEKVQDERGLTVTGDMNVATWDALFDAETGYSIRGAQILPLAQNKQVREWNRTPSGKIAERNPDFDPLRIRVERYVAHGRLREPRARNWSRAEIDRLAGKNWVGTITLNGIDVFAGDHEHGDTPTLLSRFQLRAGMNIMFRGFDGDTLFHIAGINVNADGTVTLAVDTQARNLMTVGEIIERNRESRRNRGRAWRRENRTSAATHDAIIGWFKQGGILPQDVPVTANQWSKMAVVGGQEGTVAKIRIKIPGVAFAVAVTGAERSVEFFERHIPDPFAVDGEGLTKWETNDTLADMIEDRRILYVAGTTEEPCGYKPKRHTNDAGDTTTAPITGLHIDTGGFSYRCEGSPLLWVYIYPLDDGTVQSGRIMWQQIEEGT